MKLTNAFRVPDVRVTPALRGHIQCRRRPTRESALGPGDARRRASNGQRAYRTIRLQRNEPHPTVRFSLAFILNKPLRV